MVPEGLKSLDFRTACGKYVFHRLVDKGLKILLKYEIYMFLGC